MSEEQPNIENEMLEIDALLSEEDPDFIKGLSEIKIDNAMFDLSLMDQALADPSAGAKFKAALKKMSALFNFKENYKILIPFWILIFAVSGALVFILKFKSWDHPDSLFLTSYAEWGLQPHSYNPMTESEMFFDNGRLLKNIVTLKKMVANIKASENSGANPMVAFELNVEGMSSEVVVEIKDREAEFKDLILRTTEELNYDVLVSSEGKQLLSERILAVLNSNLTQGQIRKVLYKSFIIKN